MMRKIYVVEASGNGGFNWKPVQGHRLRKDASAHMRDLREEHREMFSEINLLYRITMYCPLSPDR